MRKTAVKIIQQALNDLGHYSGTIDGVRGNNTHRAVETALTGRAGELDAGWASWSDRRKCIAYFQPRHVPLDEVVPCQFSSSFSGSMINKMCQVRYIREVSFKKKLNPRIYSIGNIFFNLLSTRGRIWPGYVNT